MNKSDSVAFQEMLAFVSAIYSRELSAGVIAIYWSALSSYDLAAVRQAFDRHVKNPDTGQFMPKPADLIRMMVGSTQDGAMIAWTKVDKAVRSVGTYEDVVFDDALIHRVLQDMGGWVAFGTKTDDDWPFVAKEFENRYRGYRTRNESPEYPALMIGLAGAHNRCGAFEIAPPVLIGDPQKASSVLLGGTNKPLIGITRASDMLPVATAPRLKG